MDYKKALIRFLPFLLLPALILGINYMTGVKATTGFGTYIIIGVVMVSMLVFFLIKSRQQQHILQTGIQGTAKVLAVDDTGRQVNFKPQLLFTLLVKVPGKDPYEVKHLDSVDYFNLTKAQIGGELNVLVDQDKPDRIIIEWQNNPDRIKL
ncbi:MAG: hypothetical protein NTU98_09030 [Bacteroidetes bacterium]|nr:hypothetical protein [Bacteroidota bacterium]